MSRLAAVARVLTAVLLAALAVRGDPPPAAAPPLALGADVLAGEVARFRTLEPERPLVWRDTVPPSAAVTALLAGAAGAGVPVTLPYPAALPRLRVEAPPDPVAMRRSALPVVVRGAPGERVALAVGDGAGPPDTVAVVVGPGGVARSAVGVLPTRPGAVTWTVRAPDAAASARARVRPEAPLRVLVASGPPTWESRFLVRALEEAGAHVVVYQALGRDRTVASPGVARPRTLDDLGAWDVVAAVGLGDDDPLLPLLGRWAAERGGGVLLAPPPPGGWRGWAAGGGGILSADAGALAWTGPAEVEPLPVEPLTVTARGIRAPEGAVAVARLDEGAGALLVAAAAVGRGRVAASGLDTWPWRMEAGRGDAHRAFWGSLVAWLAGGLAEPWTLTAAATPAGEPWVGRLEGELPDSVTVSGAALPGTLRVPVERLGPGRGRVRATPTAPGALVVADDAGREDGVVVVDGDTPLPWGPAALAVGRAGGTLGAAPSGAGGERPGSRAPWLPFLAVAALAATGWAGRRLAGEG